MSAREPQLSVVQGDCVEAMAAMPAASVDAIVTDPPYGLEFMGKDWDGADGFRRSLNGADVGRDDPFGRSSRTSAEYRAGKLFQAWCEQWAREALRVLKPGGHLLAFGGTRTYHRLACAIEDAGFEIRDTIAWLYGSGFPKSLDVGKAIDKAAGAEREVVGTKLGLPGYSLAEDAGPGGVAMSGNVDRSLRDAAAECAVTAPATPAAERWNGWGTALKPAHEPIVVARKPLTGTVATNILAHGTGALNVDGCRIAGATGDGNWTGKQKAGGYSGIRSDGKQCEDASLAGRWPANVCLDEQAAAMLDEQTGGLSSHNGTGCFNGADVAGYEGGWRAGERAGYGDSGGASRFLYVAKSSSSERSAGLDGFEDIERRTMDGGRIVSEGRTQTRGAAIARNVHPTVKPITLMRWLVRLVTPPGGTVLDPFTGSGTTGIAAALEGFDFIGIEREAEYVAIAQARIAWWARHPDGMTLVKRLEAEAEQAATAAAGQASLFDVQGGAV